MPMVHVHLKHAKKTETEEIAEMLKTMFKEQGLDDYKVFVTVGDVTVKIIEIEIIKAAQKLAEEIVEKCRGP